MICEASWRGVPIYGLVYFEDLIGADIHELLHNAAWPADLD
jgi:hypothetical protein